MSDLHPDLRSAPPAALVAPSDALAIGAHPDDIEFGAGATLAAWASAGCCVTMAVVTDGSKGSWDSSVTPASLAARRRAEQREAAAELGAAEVVFLDHIDGEVENTLSLRAELCGLIRRVRPHVVLSHDPWQRYQLHPDHRAVGMAVVDAVVAARDHFFFPEQVAEGLAAHRPAALLLWSPDEPNHWEDAAPTLDRKVAALLRHVSQGATTMGNAHAGPAEQRAFRGRIENRAARLGAAAGMTSAEAFRRINP